MKPVDIIILLLLFAFMAFCIKKALPHFKGEGGGCCGGGGPNTIADDKTLENPILGKKVIKIEGMSCENCTNRVKKALNKIDGISATVSLTRECATVSYDREVDEAVMKNAVENLGYTVTEIYE